MSLLDRCVLSSSPSEEDMVGLYTFEPGQQQADGLGANHHQRYRHDRILVIIASLVSLTSIIVAVV